MGRLRIISIAVIVATGILGAIQVAGPESLGVSAIMIRWLGIVAAGLGILQGFLPRVTGPTTDPSTIADRVSSLPSSDQREIVNSVVASANTSQDMDAVPMLVGAVSNLSRLDRDRLVLMLEGRNALITKPPTWTDATGAPIIPK